MKNLNDLFKGHRGVPEAAPTALPDAAPEEPAEMTAPASDVKVLFRCVQNVGIRTCGTSEDDLILVHTIYTDYINRHCKELNKCSLKHPPFSLSDNGNAEATKYVFFVSASQEGAVLKALVDLGAHTLMWAGLDDEDRTIYLIEEPDVAQRALRMAGVNVDNVDYITLSFSDEGLAEGIELPSGFRVRGVGESVMFMCGFQSLLYRNGWEYTPVYETMLAPEELQDLRAQSAPEMAMFEGYVNSIGKGGTDAE